MLSPRKPLLGALFVLAITGLALIFTSSALTKGNGPKQRLGAAAGTTNETYNTEDVDVAAAVKPLPFCKKKQKSTKKHPCRKKAKASAALRENPPVAGWKFGLFVNNNVNGTSTLSVRLTRTKGNASERHFYLFQLAAGSVTVAPDLSSGTIDTGNQLGQFGAIKVTFGNPTGLVTGTAVPGCAGNWQKRTGALTGSIRFVADSTYFKTIVRTSMPTTLNANIGAPPACTTPPTTCTHTTFFTTGIFSGTANFFEAFSTAGVLSYVDFLTQAVGPATETHVLTETNLPAADLAPAADLSTATVSTTGATAFSGSLTYTAGAPATKFPNSTCGGTPALFSQGTATGGITAKFAAIPANTPPPNPATVEIS